MFVYRVISFGRPCGPEQVILFRGEGGLFLVVGHERALVLCFAEQPSLLFQPRLF